MTQSPNIVILAAGQGKRMYSRLPKVLHPLAGRPLLVHVLEAARALHPAKLVVVYGHGGEQVREAIAAPDAVWVKQEPQLGTGDALAQALPHLAGDGMTLVLYGDVPLIAPETLSAMLEAGRGVTVLTVKLDDPAGYGRIVRNAKGNITRIVEEKDASVQQRRINEVNTGMMALPTAHLSKWLGRLSNDNAQREYYLTDVIALALTDKIAVDSASPRDAWETLGVNNKQQLAQLERTYQWRYATRLLAQGVTLADPMRLDVRGELECGADVTIDVNCVFEGNVQLADGATVGANCVLKNVEIGPNARIEPFTLIDDAVVGAGCRIGPYARIRPGSRLAEDVHIGNFVEVKASEIAARSKANHLSYVGDSSVGRDVNIGAGTITCNYDGANKHRTVIEDEVHIGSDVQLVAPVRVGRGATIGAGATIVRDAPAGELTLTRKEQITLPGWKRPRKERKE